MITRWLPAFLLCSLPLTAGAQTLTTNDPPEQKIIELVLKLLFAFGVGVAPWLTGKLTAGLANVPFAVRAAISSAITAIIGSIFGAIPDFPLTIESSAEIGASWGVVGQWYAQKSPAIFTPKTVPPEPAPPGPQP